MTKSDFPQFDYEALLYASEIEVTYTDGLVKNYIVSNYWDTTPLVVDAIECTDPSVSINAPEDDRYPILYVPDPTIASIKILCHIDHPNHGGHPEIAINFPTIDVLYARRAVKS